MKNGIYRSLFGAAVTLAIPATVQAEELKGGGQADPGTWRISTGINYSQGDYGDVQDTKVVSAPVALKYKRGGFSLRVSVPYVHIDGPGSLLDTPQGRDAGFGDDSGFDDNGGSSGSDSSNSGSGSSSSNSGSGSSSSNSGSGSSGSNSGSGSSGSGSGGSGSSHSGGADDSASGGSAVSGVGGGVVAPGVTNNRRGGIGDIAVTMAYSFDLGRTTYFDVSGRLKVPTASTAKRLGTGKVDFTVGADLVQDIGLATVYAGGRHKFMGKPAGSTLRDTWGFGAGASYRLGGAVIGADYDWQQSSSAGNGPSSEVTGWINFGLSRKLRMQVFASTGFTSNSADFAGGLSLSYRLN